MSAFILHHGDCLEVLKTLPDDSVDSIVTDPPYGLSFMGKKWDYDVPSMDVWRECLRVLKPGGHLLSFAGSRTYHRMTIAIEDAGFEIRDQIMWVYGCLDDATEVATEHGVMPYHKTKIGDRVLCYNPSNGEYSYQPILEIVEYEYSDTAYRLVGDFGEQVVSRNHRVIVECGGSEAFQLAETLEREARVPVLEDLPALQQAIHDAHAGAGRAQQDMRAGMCGGDNRSEELGSKAAGNPQGADGGLRGVREAGMETGCVAAQGGDANVQPQMQWGAARSGMGDTCAQGAVGMVGGIGSSPRGAHDWAEQSGVEGRSNVSQPEGSLRRSADQVRAMPCWSNEHGPRGRLCHGASSCGGTGGWETTDANGVRASHQSRCDGQSAGEPDAVRHERTAQGIRAWGGHRSAVVRVVPFHYTGKVWCLRVPTGAFVAVRNGVAFPTGNSGFPKSLDVSKAIDKVRDWSLVERLSEEIKRARAKSGMSLAEIGQATLAATDGTYGKWYHRGGHMFFETGRSLPSRPEWEHLRHVLPIAPEFAEVYDEAEREVVGRSENGIAGGTGKHAGQDAAYGFAGAYDITAPATDAARQWQGWGTALKPSHEPICVARKPLVGTVAENVLAHGTGGVNIDGCRVGTEGGTAKGSPPKGESKGIYGNGINGACDILDIGKGRWPANLIHDGSEEVTNLLGDAARFFYCSKASKKDRNDGCQGVMTWENVDLQSAQMVVQQLQKATSDISILLQDGCEWSTILFGNEQTARFLPAIKCIIEMATKQTTQSATSNCSVPLNTNDFIRAAIETMKVCGSSPADFAEYTNPSKLNTTCEKTESAAAAVHAVFKMLCDANESAKVGNVHSTVKPTDLMRYLCRLVTPPGGVVLDPFMGSGSTGKAAVLEGFRFIGIEREAEYLEIARARIEAVMRQPELIA